MTESYADPCPPSNRGNKSPTQKTNLQVIPVLDRLRLETWTRAHPDEIHDSLLGRTKTTDPRTVMRGPQRCLETRSWDSPPNTPGGLYLGVLDKPEERLVSVEYNPAHAPWKWEMTLARLAEAVGRPIGEWWVSRVDVAFDFPIERSRFTLEGTKRRKVELFLPSGGAVETANLKHTAKYPGMTLYDKRAERRAKGEESGDPWTRMEVKLRPKETRWSELADMPMPAVGARFLYLHFGDDEMNRDQLTSLHFAHLQEFATYNPIRARQLMEEVAATRGLGKEAYDCMLDEVHLGRIWEQSGRHAVSIVESPPAVRSSA